MTGDFLIMPTKVEIDTRLFKAITKIAKSENISNDEVLSEALEIGIKTLEKRKSTIPEHLIANKDTYNPSQKSIMSMAGIIKTDKPVDVAKIVDEVRRMEY